MTQKKIVFIITGMLLVLILIKVISVGVDFGKFVADNVNGEPEREYYVFYLHHKFLEEFNLDDVHPEYGKAEYHAILDTFRNAGFTIISEKRPAKTDMRIYAKKVVAQIDSLLDLGVKPRNITVIGSSKGGYIAQYVSTYLANPDVNYVFIGAFQDQDIEAYPDIQWCGHILSIYADDDFYGVPAKRRVESSKLKVSNFKEIELHTHIGHGFLYKPMEEWVRPSIAWAKREP